MAHNFSHEGSGGAGTGELASHNLAALLAERAQDDSAALAWEGGSLSYRELNLLVASARTWLAERGMSPGDRVALALPNVPQMVVLYYAAVSLGAVAVPMHPLLTAREVAHILSDSGASLLVAWQGSRVAEESAEHGIPVELLGADTLPTGRTEPTAWEPLAVQGSDPAVLLYTSGTTGAPKGACLTHSNMLSNARTCVGVFGFTPKDTVFGGLPLFHAFGQTVSMNAVFAAGATVALLPRFTPDGAARLSRDARVTVFAAVPSMYSAVAAALETDTVLAGELKGQIRCGISGGSALPASVHADIERLLAFPVYEGYGLSETAPVVSFNRAEFGLVMGSVGRALPGVQVQVRDEAGGLVPAGEPGQLWVAGPNVMAGYWNNPQATAEVMDGPWFATGDVATVDEAGNIFIVDRLKDMILRNGYSVYPREIEDVLYQHPQVRLAAVVGLGSETVGEEVVAVLVPRQPLEDDQARLMEGELDALCREQLAAYKRPRRFVVRQELPLGITGKVLKRELVKTLALEG